MLVTILKKNFKIYTKKPLHISKNQPEFTTTVPALEDKIGNYDGYESG